MKRAIFAVTVGGTNVTSTFASYLISINVSDAAGQTSDTASIELDDTDGRLVMPQKGALVSIMLGWEGGGLAQVFYGTVDEVSASGSRGSGRTLSISATGMDTSGKAKEPQRLHLDNTTIGEAMQKAGKVAGLTVTIDSELASIARDYISLDDESFTAFGERIAHEVGGTFKIVGDRAVLAKRNGGTSASGSALSSVVAAWGINLHSYNISPVLGRAYEKKTAVRYYDKKKAEWKVTEQDTGTDGAETKKTSINSAADEETAKAQAKSDAEESDRKKGGGSVTIEGNPLAQPEGMCGVIGCRPGVDGSYRIESVGHRYSRGGGFVTQLQLKQPQGGAGRDSR